jgi:uncharacterized membrane protein YccC
MKTEQILGGRKVAAFIFLIAGLATLLLGLRDWPHPFAVAQFVATSVLWLRAIFWLTSKQPKSLGSIRLGENLDRPA